MFFQTDIHIILFALTLGKAEGLYDCAYVHSNYINMRSIFHMLRLDTEVIREEYYRARPETPRSIVTFL
jgi:hypothetical protein